MSFLDRFRRQHVSQSGPELRDALIAAVAAKDTPAFTALINSNAAAVRQSFAAWLTCPPDIAADPPAMQRYASGLMVIATVFQQSGDASLMAMLTQPEDNPITTWDRDMQSADTLVSAGQPTQAVELLERTLRSMEGLRGSGVDQYRPRVLGRLGIALYRAGEQKRATEVTQQALALCEAASDQAGIDAYRKNLDVIRGRGELVMYDLGEGRTSWEIRGGDPVPDEAEDLHHEGREAGTRGDHQQALALFTRAAALAPRWPYPLYDRAYTHLLMKNDAAALADYERVLELSPRGFFTAHVAADTLRREAGGQLMSGLFRAYSMLEHMDEEQRRRIVAQLVEKEPQFAPGWLKWAALAGDPREQLAALERGLAANPDPSTRGMLLLNKAARLQGSGDRDGAVAILRALAADPASTEQSEALAKDSLRRLGAPSELERA